MPLVPLTRYVLLLLVGLGGHEVITGQGKVWRQYTRDDGLPTMEIWSIIQASDDLLWFSSKKGVFSFDGYQFHEPVDTSVYRGAEAFFPAEDSEGRIWFSRIDKQVWYVENDTIRPWKYNHVLDSVRDDFHLIYQIRFDTNGDIWIHAGGLGFFVVNARGELRRIRGSEHRNVLFGRVGGKMVFGFQGAVSSSSTDQPQLVDWVSLKEGALKKSGHFRHLARDGYDFFSIAAGKRDEIFIKAGQEICIWENETLRTLTKVDLPQSRFTASKDGKFVLTCMDITQAGLYYMASLDEMTSGKRLNILPGKRTYYAHFDRDGGLWVTALGEGIFYCKNPDVDLYDLVPNSDLKDVYVLAFDGTDQIYAGVETHVVQMDVRTGKFTSISGPGLVGDWTSMYFEPMDKTLWVGSGLSVFKDNTWHPVWFSSGAASPKQVVNAKTIHPSPDVDRLWISSTFGFFQVNRVTREVTRIGRDTSEAHSLRTHDVIEDQQGRVWVSTIQGLKCWVHDQYEPPPIGHEVLRYPVSSLLLLEDGHVVVGTRGGGVLIYRDQQSIIHLSTREGLTSDQVTRLRSIPGAGFLVCTDAGLSIVAAESGKEWNVRAINRLHGLPSDVIHDALVLQDGLWIGTDKGLVHWSSDTRMTDIPIPVITSFRVNQREVPLSERLFMSHQENHIEISFHSTHFRSEGKIAFRYRLLDADTAFHETSFRRVDFSELAPGQYGFEVQAQREDGTWSDSAIQRFTIRPPWWKTGWFISLGIISMALGGFLVIRNKNKAFREKTEVALKMKELELAALRAQINPHFIFNCLGSIQQFIASNEPESATRYLARFAKLVRLSLHSSVDGKHSLADEISMLDNYLALEQMRFRGKFVYHIITSEALDTENVFLPSMLLQPFVENAVLHGVGEVKGEGRIAIDFSQAGHLLKIVIADNGPGIPEGQNGGSGNHKSFGMSLTHRRLDLIAGGKGAAVILKRNKIDPDGRVAGFEVIVEMPIE